MTHARALRWLEPAGVALVLLLFAAFAGYEAWLIAPRTGLSGFLRTDFFAQWSFAHFVQAGGGADIYDRDVLSRFQHDLAPGLRQVFPFPYPPVYLFALWPLGGLAIGPAYITAMAASLALFAAAAWRRGLGWSAGALLALAPGAVVCVVYGQTGLLTAAFLAGGLRLRPSHPVLAGMVFALLLIKPQFAILVPLALVAARDWRCFAAAAFTAAALVAASTAAFGWIAWTRWFAALPEHGAYVDRAVSSYVKPTIRETLAFLGASPSLAWTAAGCVAILAAAAVWRAYRRRAALADAVLIAATLAASPYGFIYDLPVLSVAAVALYAARPPTWTALIDDAAATLALATPAVMALTTRFHWIGAVALLLLLATLAARALSPPAPAASAR